MLFILKRDAILTPNPKEWRESMKTREKMLSIEWKKHILNENDQSYHKQDFGKTIQKANKKAVL